MIPKVIVDQTLSREVSKYCKSFLANTMYGECKNFCPFCNNGNPYKCTDKYIAEHPDDVRDILQKYQKE